MRGNVKKFFAAMLAGSMVMNTLSFNTLAVENNSSIQIVENGGKSYYLADPLDGEVASAENFDVWTNKTIEGTAYEDEFEITLQVGSTVKAVPNDAAVVLVVDTSGSMMKDKDGYAWGKKGVLPSDGRKLRIDYARDAAIEFAENFVKNSGNSKRMLSVVGFGNNAFTCLPWTNVNDNGSLKEESRKTLEGINVNYPLGYQNFWDYEKIDDIQLGSYSGGPLEYIKAENWSDEEYVHETKSYEQSFFIDYPQICYMTQYEEASPANASPSNAKVASDSSSRIGWYCNYDNCTSLVENHIHCTYEECDNIISGHKHCSVCGVTDTDNNEHKHCVYEGCEELESHEHCEYEKCANPPGHTHCTRRYYCDADHTDDMHCKSLMEKCGRTDVHTHIKGCTVNYCQDTTPNHEHACVYGAGGIKYPFADYDINAYNMDTARCLNPDPYHTHQIYDGDAFIINFNRVYQAWNNICTNLEGGLTLARNLINAGLKNNGAIADVDEVYVILLTDGQPTWYVDQSMLPDIDNEVEFIPGSQGGNNVSKWEDIKDIVAGEDESDGSDVALAKEIQQVAEFYAVMYGGELNETLDGNHKFSSVKCIDWFKGTEPGYVGADLVIESQKADELGEAFATIQKRIDLLAKAWIVSDEMGDGVSFESFVANGEYAVLNADETTISWNLGDMEPECGSGTVEDPFIYTLKYKVTLNSDEKEVKEISKAYDADNNLPAVWTNKSAKLQYFMVEKAELGNMSVEEIEEILQSAEFKKPSVKAFYSDYEFVKKNSKTEDVIENAGFTLYKDGIAATREVISDHEGSVEFSNIASGVYVLKETKIPDGMIRMPDRVMKVSYGRVTTLDGREPDAVIYNDPVGTKYNIVINYWDKEDNHLLNSYVSDMMESGSPYDVSDRDDEVSFGGYTYDSQSGDMVIGTLDANKVINVYYVKKVEPSEPETSEPETTPSYVDDDDDEPETTPTTTAPSTEAPTLPTEPITDIVPETEPLPYVDPNAGPEDIPEEVIQAYYERYMNDEIDLDDIPVGVLGAFFEKEFPMAVLPATGDVGGFWTWMMWISLIGLAITSVIDRKRVR